MDKHVMVRNGIIIHTNIELLSRDVFPGQSAQKIAKIGKQCFVNELTSTSNC